MPAATNRAILITNPTNDLSLTTLLGRISEGKHVMSVGKRDSIFSQGDRADSVYFIQTGRVKVSVVSYSGKEGVLEMLGPQTFLGEESLAKHPLRTSTATALEPSTMLQVKKRAMLDALRAQPDLSERFMAFLLKRTIDLEEDVCDHIFNQSEKRLARVLLKLAQLRGYERWQDATITRLSHETLAVMVGTTRSRITIFMNKFKSMGLIAYTRHGETTALK